MKKSLLWAPIVLLVVTVVSQCKKSTSENVEENPASVAQGLGNLKDHEDNFVVSNNASASLSFIDVITKTITKNLSIPNSVPFYMVYLPLKDKIYLTDAGNHAVQIIDAATQTVSGSISVASGTIMHIVGVQTKNRLWVVNNTAKTVTEINANNNQIVYTLQLATTPHDIAVNSNGTRIYISRQNGTNWQVDTYSTDLETTGNYTLLDSRTFGANWLHLYYSAANNKLYAADQGLGKYWALDPANLNSAALSVNIAGAHGVTLSSDERYSYVGSITENKVYIIDNSTLTIASSMTSSVSPASHNLAVNLSKDVLLGTHSGPSSVATSAIPVNNGTLVASQESTITVGTNPMAVLYYARKKNRTQ
jgi:DNA-binding beta-propeller fold protein YncE